MGHVCNTDTDTFHCYSDSWPYYDRVLCIVEVHGHGLGFYNYSHDFPGNRVYDCYCIGYDFVVMRLTDSDNFETDIDYTEVFGFYLVV